MFALYQQYGVPKEAGKPVLDLRLTEQAMREAFVADPGTLSDVINQEVAFHRPLVARDHSCRAYVQMLTRVLGIGGADVIAEHDEQMRAALAHATPPQKSALDVSKIVAKEG